MKIGEKVLRIVPTNMLASMSGAAFAEKSATEIKLTYTDGTSETVSLSRLTILIDETTNWFALVEQIQKESRK